MEQDPETSLNYVGARYYQSQTARFTRPDDPGFADPFNPQSMNLYSYALNNPLRWVDPTGHEAECPPGYPEGTFCSGVTEEDRWRRAQEAWADALRFFQRSEQYFQAQLLAAQQREQPQQPTPTASLLRTAGSCATEHYGLTAAAAGVGALGIPVPKSAVVRGGLGGAGVSESMSLASAIGWKLFGRSQPRVGARMLNTTRLFGVVGRAAPVVSAGLFAWDAASIGYCTYQGMN